MPLGKNMMQGGFSAGQVSAIGGQIANALVAAGTTQGTALAITADINVFGTVAASAGAKLFAAMPGDSQVVYNGGANALAIYPPTGAKINGIAVNGAMLLAVNTVVELFCVSSTQWIGQLSA